MIEFEFSLRCPQPARETWAKLVDVDRHTHAVPLTRLRPAGVTMAAGLEFVAETRLGPWRLLECGSSRPSLRAPPPQARWSSPNCVHFAAGSSLASRPGPTRRR